MQDVKFFEGESTSNQHSLVSMNPLAAPKRRVGRVLAVGIFDFWLFGWRLNPGSSFPEMILVHPKNITPYDLGRVW